LDIPNVIREVFTDWEAYLAKPSDDRTVEVVLRLLEEAEENASETEDDGDDGDLVSLQ